MKSLWNNESGAVGYLLLIEFLLSIFVTFLVYMLIEDIVGFFNVNFYTGTPLDITDPGITWTRDTLMAIFVYMPIFFVSFISIKAILESTIRRA